MRKIFLTLTIVFILFSCSNSPKKEAKLEWNNIFLYENNIKKNALTNDWNIETANISILIAKDIEDKNLLQAFGYTTDWNVCDWDKIKVFIAYDILNSDKEYSFIEKIIYTCGWWKDRKRIKEEEYYILSYNENNPTYYKLNYSLPNGIIPDISTGNTKPAFIVHSNLNSLSNDEMEKIWYKVKWEWWDTNYIKTINFEEEYTKAKGLSNNK